MKKKIVIDTNIIVSAMWNKGKAYEFMRNVIDGQYVVLVNDEILKEYKEVLFRPRFDFEKTDIIYVLNWFENNAIKSTHKKSNIEMLDEKDRAFYDLAKKCNALLVTGNLKHYPADELVTSLNEITENGI